jgi:hypothetical protein
MTKRFVIYDEIQTDWYAPEMKKPQLVLRQVGHTWSIVRIKAYAQYGSEVVASGLKRADAERFIKLAKEESDGDSKA